MDLIPIECGSCKAKLKIKAHPGRMPTEVKCPKCGKPIPVGKSVTPSPAATQATPPPAAASTAKGAPIAPAPAVPATPTPVAPPPPPPASSTAQLTAPPKPAGATPSPKTPSAGPKKAAAPIVLGQAAETSSAATIPATCPACKWSTKVTTSLIGKKIRCKQCSGIILIELPGAPPPTPIVQPVAEVLQPSVISEPPPPPPPPPAPTITPAPVKEVTLNPALESVSAVSPGTTVLIGEIASLKSRLEISSRESANNAHLLTEAKTRLTEAQNRAHMAELRVQEAEKALHDLAGKNAVENMTATRTISDLQVKLAALHQTIAGFAADYKADLDVMEKKASALREKISKLGS